MGSPKRQRKKYSTPLHPWRKLKIEQDKEITNEYGLKNKKEIWRAESLLRKFKAHSKHLIAEQTEQAEKEKKQLIEKLTKLNLIHPNAPIEDILGLDLKDLLNRRLQTMVYNKNLARSIKQARQFILHKHILVDGKKVNVPSYLVSKDEEDKISFDPESSLHNIEHPERVKKKEKPKEEKKEEEKEEKKVKRKIVKRKKKKLSKKTTQAKDIRKKR
jgi:small subunit ribosomal protein S4